MYRAIPVASKACADRVQKREDEAHKRRMKEIRPTVDNSVPLAHSMDHIRNNLKREQRLEERYHLIDRENRMLLQRMSDIMKTPTLSNSRARSGPVSLQRDSHKTDLQRITQENHRILKRIQEAQPVYSHVAWEDSFRRSATYLKNTAEFPIVLLKRKTSTAGLHPLTSKSPQSSSTTMNPMKDDVKSQSREATEDSLRYVLKEGKRIGQQYYLVEMATDGRTLAISAYNGDSQRTLELLVNEKNHRRLYREANGDYNVVAGKLRVEGDQLSLDAPPSPSRDK
mmetsp:Transcript_46950/g.102092  ORF Transcript_46950/g.102092 Transcript_46950/m.102092 type:complete len:283 (+) Transcript_46950:115-963(+)